ncbi:glucose-1-phosphate cytidylyltransferase [Clostridium butyricum]|uniref:glucose-1-phosphate cytidylyltransferase n=1 Tax=Clostridium butyricum TaxID=1492 RepID=UPI003467C0F8
MKVVLLAGGLGTRISEESHLRPKPMIEIGGMPILWHIMKIYSSYGHNDFIICCGYKAHMVKEYFADYYLHRSDVTFDFGDNNNMIVHNNFAEPWKVTLVDTGLNTMTGGRIKRIEKYIDNEPFMLTYGDGVCNVDISKLVEYHQSHGKIATMTAINIGQRFGVLDINEDNGINAFREKNDDDGSMINGGYMVLNPEIFNYIEGDDTVFEKVPLETVANMGQLMAFKHEGFWKCMDTQRDKHQLEEMWESGNAPWKIW